MQKLISFVFPMYNEEGNIEELWKRMEPILLKLSNTYKSEVIFVNDGSKDSTLEKLGSLYKQHPDTIKVVAFAKNYGHQIAVTAGQDIAQGDAVIIMDSDLQDPPEVALQLIEKWAKGADVVYAKRRTYKTNPIKKTLAWVFYRILKSIANVDIPVDTGDFRLLSKRVNEEMKRYKEKSRYLRGMTSLMGYTVDFVEFDRGHRFSGKTKYPFRKSLQLALNGITGFSTAPIQLITFVGFFFAFLAIVGGFFYILYSIVTGTNVSGWVSIMSIMILFFGIVMVMMGILGEYIGRIYTEVLDRPLYTVDYYLGTKKPEKTTQQRMV